MTSRRVWVRRGFWAAIAGLAGQQVWRHGRDYVFADQFAIVVPGKIYRGAWQQPWPMRRVVTNYKIKTVVALAHPANHPLAVREKAMAGELGYRWVHIPIVDHRVDGVMQTVVDQLDRAAAVLADPANQPVYFHCHHGINRASMVQMAYRTKYCGWSLEEATAEIARTYGLVEVAHGLDYRQVERFYKQRVPAQSTTGANCHRRASKRDFHGPILSAPESSGALLKFIDRNDLGQRPRADSRLATLIPSALDLQ